MDDLRSVFPTRITRGALLRSDGVAVGLVVGGAPAWDLRARDDCAQIGDAYQRVLCALETALDLYVLDQPPDLHDAIATLHACQGAHDHLLCADVLGAIAEYLTTLTQHNGSRAKQAIWAVAVPRGPTPPRPVGWTLAALLQRSPTQVAQIGAAALAQAVDQARRLADALVALDGQPAPRLLEAEEIARLLYRCADPIRAQRYPLMGALLDRVRRVVQTEGTP